MRGRLTDWLYNGYSTKHAWPHLRAMLCKKQEQNQYIVLKSCIFVSRLIHPPDYPKDGPNGRSPYLSSCKLHGGHHDQHGDHHGGKGHHGHGGLGHHGSDPEKNPFSPLDSPHAPPSGSLPASPVIVMPPLFLESQAAQLTCLHPILIGFWLSDISAYALHLQVEDDCSPRLTSRGHTPTFDHRWDDSSTHSQEKGTHNIDLIYVLQRLFCDKYTNIKKTHKNHINIQRYNYKKIHI